VTPQTIPRTDISALFRPSRAQAKPFCFNDLRAEDKGEKIAPRHYQVGVPVFVA
jgi:hypothetical protein